MGRQRRQVNVRLAGELSLGSAAIRRRFLAEAVPYVVARTKAAMNRRTPKPGNLSIWQTTGFSWLSIAWPPFKATCPAAPQKHG